MENVDRCFIKGTEIQLSDGRTLPIECITTNDSVIGIDGKNKKITKIHEGEELLYEVNQQLGNNYIVNGDHVLVLKITNHEGIHWDAKRKYYKARYVQDLRLHDKCFRGTTESEEEKKILHKRAAKFLKDTSKEVGYNKGFDIIEISVEKYMKLPLNIRNGLYGLKCAVEFDEKDTELDPYMLGLWLGDGTSSAPSFTNKDVVILDHVENYAISNDLRVTKRKNPSNCYVYRISRKPKGRNTFLESLKKYNLINNKHIPDDFLYNSREVRLKILAGIIDTDGYMHDNTYEIAQKSDKIAEGIIFLARSLGFRATCKKKEKKCHKPDGTIVPGMYNIMNITGENLNELPILLQYKKTNSNPNKNRLLTKISVLEHGVGKYVGFQIEGDGKFIAPDFTVLA